MVYKTFWYFCVFSNLKLIGWLIFKKKLILVIKWGINRENILKFGNKKMIEWGIFTEKKHPKYLKNFNWKFHKNQEENKYNIFTIIFIILLLICFDCYSAEEQWRKSRRVKECSWKTEDEQRQKGSAEQAVVEEQSVKKKSIGEEQVRKAGRVKRMIIFRQCKEKGLLLFSRW